MNRRRFIKTGLLIGSGLSLSRLPLSSLIADAPGLFKFDPEQPVISAPEDPQLWPEFRWQLAAWRKEMRERLHYSPALYERPDFAWVSSSFACCFLMLCDERFYDCRRNRFAARDFVIRARREFGGFDSIVLWHAYPRIGFDDRNQFDFYRDMPGGLRGIRHLTDELHGLGTRVYIDYNPWDIGTRREGKTDLAALAELVSALQVDGIFLDTLDRGAAEFRAQLDRVRNGVVLESEIALPLGRVHDHHMSWAQGFGDGPVPGVLRNKWFERRHMQHQIQRWHCDHTQELHSAWMNGSGILVWENVFGSANDWRPADRVLLRSMLPIQRRFSRLFAGEQWTPFVATSMPDVYASLWEGPGLRLWTLVNRSNQNREGALLPIQSRNGEHVYDLILGKPVPVPRGLSPARELTGKLGPRGIGCFVAGSADALGRDFKGFLNAQRDLCQRAASGLRPRSVITTLTGIRRTSLIRPDSVPEDMASIPGASLRLKTVFRVRECGFYDSAPPDFAAHPLHTTITLEREIGLKPYAIDLAPVTNAEFARFLKASGYRPGCAHNFLKHWVSGVPPAGREEHPVVYVDLQDARAYAHWKHRRLPTEDEWQYAAQGPDERVYPWGNQMLPDRCNQGQSGTTTPVRAFPRGRSPFGIYDLCGNVWEWTESERSDGRTRFCIIRGGAFYRAAGSDWYADGGAQPCNFAAKFLLMWPGLDRCATIGFRCAGDVRRP